MTDKVVLFDTNALPREYDFRSGFWLSILRLCDATGHKPAVSEVVLHESVNMRRQNYIDAANKLASATKEIGKFYGEIDVYVPDVEEIIAEWKESIETTFSVIPLHGDDATQALVREALRRPPAREGRGGRDAAIWMTALRLVGEGKKVLFVSNNTKDFGEGKRGLNLTLVQELDALPMGRGSLEYLLTPDSLVAHLATKISAPAFDEVELKLAFEAAVRATAMTALEGSGFELYALEATEPASISLADWKVIGSYDVESEGLALVRGMALIETSDQAMLEFSFRGWVDFTISTAEIMGATIEEVRFLGLKSATAVTSPNDLDE